MYIASVEVVSRNRPRRIVWAYEGALAGRCARAGSAERGDGAVASTQEAVSHVARVNVVSVNHSRHVDVPREGSLESACTRGRNVEGGDSAVASAEDSRDTRSYRQGRFPESSPPG